MHGDVLLIGKRILQNDAVAGLFSRHVASLTRATAVPQGVGVHNTASVQMKRSVRGTAPASSAAPMEAARATYLLQAEKRFAHTVRLSIDICPDPSSTVLDIGRSHLSHRLLAYYNSVTTLGLPLEVTRQYPHSTAAEPPARKDYAGHIVCDLNTAQYRERLDVDRTFDLIVFADVIEHLTTAPELVLRLLRSLLSEGGSILCTTPNAASLNKRVLLAMGKNPFERIRLDPNNPGHFREYTKAELYEIGESAGLFVVSHGYVDYMLPRGSWLRRAAVIAAHQFPRIIRPLSAGQFIIYR